MPATSGARGAGGQVSCDTGSTDTLRGERGFAGGGMIVPSHLEKVGGIGGGPRAFGPSGTAT